MIPAPTVLARLKSAAVTGAMAPRLAGGSIVVGGDAIGRIRALKSGGVWVELSIARDTDIDEIVVELRNALIAERRTSTASQDAMAQ